MRCACVLRAHTICALSGARSVKNWVREAAVLGGTEPNGNQSRPGDCGFVRDRTGATSAADTRWGRSRKTRAKTGSQWLGPYSCGRRGSVGLAVPPARGGPGSRLEAGTAGIGPGPRVGDARPQPQFRAGVEALGRWRVLPAKTWSPCHPSPGLEREGSSAGGAG